MAEQKLTDKQDRFCHEYIIDLNGSQAAIRAKYSKNSARQIATEMLSKPYIQDRIAELQSKTFKRLDITAESVLEKFVEIRDRCMQKEPVYDFTEDSEDGEPIEWKFDASNALRANESLGKHLKLFTDRIEIEITKMPEIKITK